MPTKVIGSGQCYSGKQQKLFPLLGLLLNPKLPDYSQLAQTVTSSRSIFKMISSQQEKLFPQLFIFQCVSSLALLRLLSYLQSQEESI